MVVWALVLIMNSKKIAKKIKRKSLIMYCDNKWKSKNVEKKKKYERKKRKKQKRKKESDESGKKLKMSSNKKKTRKKQSSMKYNRQMLRLFKIRVKVRRKYRLKKLTLC